MEKNQKNSDFTLGILVIVLTAGFTTLCMGVYFRIGVCIAVGLLFTVLSTGPVISALKEEKK